MRPTSPPSGHLPHSERPSGPDRQDDSAAAVTAPSIQLPKGGGAIRGIGEKFSANPATGTGSMSVPIATSPGRAGFGPQLSLSYDSGAGNGPFGLGWSLSLPSIRRKTDKGLPRYMDRTASDVFTLAGAEDLVPVLDADARVPQPVVTRVHGKDYLVCTYRPRIEGLFALIERWVERDVPANMFWRTVGRDNLTTWYGKAEDSRIADPHDAIHIFEWLVCETCDDKGNVVVYSYKREDGAGVSMQSLPEVNRLPTQRTANVYPKRIRYGNVNPYMPTLAQAGAPWAHAADEAGQQWMFEVVFDYGDHPGPAPATTPTADWPARVDPWSSHRAGFEVRTYRLCRRVLMFHHFEPELGAADYLVRSTDFDYLEPAEASDPAQRGYTVLASITQRSYQKRVSTDATYQSRDFPPVTFTYSDADVDPTLRTVEAEEVENLPVGTHGAGYQWIDLDGEGLSGVLTEQGGAWYYKPNTGDATFGPSRVVAREPAMAALASGRQQFLDLSGNGQVDLVAFGGAAPGFHERDLAEGWTRFVPFASLPNIDWNGRNLRFVDLTGDGHADALITEDEVFTWYPSLAADGFGAGTRIANAVDDSTGPHLVFADGSDTIFLADMCGDGLADLVRIRNGDVCYWPNLGYGRFGRKVALANAPWFDHVDFFDPRRIRLADIDGSGPIDIIYLGRQSAQLYFNRSGNSLSAGLDVGLSMASESLAGVQVADLLGNGTACLVWSSQLPADARHPVRYIDLMGKKPHLLTGIDNNLGGTTEIEYTPSTRFYLDDKRDRTPWVTRLPFPVHCVSKVTQRDKWRGTAFSSTYSYHHGYFDGPEREFRGFGCVRQIDVESYGSSVENNIDSPFVSADRTLYQPPIQTITWYHTGAALDRQRTLSQFAQEYFPQRFAARLPDPAQFPDAFREKPLPEPELPGDLNADEWREALRACKGMVLRQEVYELDVDDLAGPAQQQTPVRIFSSATHNCHIQQLQPRGENLHGVYIVIESEALTYQYELALPKSGGVVQPHPRIAHTLNLRHDEQGNVQQSIAVAYGRWAPGDYPGLAHAELIAQVQGEFHIAYSETRYTRDVIQPAQPPGTTYALRHHRLRMACELLTYELTGIDKADPHYYSPADFRVLDLSEEYGHQPGETPPPHPVTRALYHEPPHSQVAQKRIVNQTRTRFFDDASDTAPPVDALPFRRHGPRGLKYEDYTLALTDALLDRVFAAVDTAGLRDILDAPESGYILGSEIDPALTAQYWIRTGTAGFAPDAHQHFYLPERYRDAFGKVTTIQYDGRHLFVTTRTDARGNSTRIADFDFRVLTPREVVDANGNHSETITDVRGQVVAVAVKGKEIGGTWQGDHMSGFDFDLANPSRTTVVAFCMANDADRVQAATWLGSATTRFVYHLGDAGGRWAQRPAGACAISRERHARQVTLDPAHQNPLQITLECSDGSGQVLMKKVQAEPEHPGGPLRWIVNGLTLLNNKGKPVKQYEPSFVPDFGCQLPQAFGVSPTMYYDAPGRLMRTEYPDGTLSRVEFSPWHVRTFDPSDTVLETGWYTKRSAAGAAAEDRRAAQLAANHAGTPSVTILDSLGREVISVAHNRTPDTAGVWQDEYHVTCTRLDAEGKPLWIRDARGNLVMQYIAPPKPNTDPSDVLPSTAVPCYDIAGNLLYQHSMDAGDRWTLADAAGKPLLSWDLNDRTRDDGSVQSERRLFHTRYDALHRPIEQWLGINDRPAALIEAFEYTDVDSFKNAAGVLDQAGLGQAQRANLIGQATRHYDPSGLATVERADFQAIVEEVTRRLVSDVTTDLVDWNVTVRGSLLESDVFRHVTEHDALGRMTTLYNWHRDALPDRTAVYKPTYNERGLLTSETLHVRATKTMTNGAIAFTPNADTTKTAEAITRIEWNARGQKTHLELGNGTVTDYTYDEDTFRLISLRTTRNTRDVQDVSYTYDPVGNITRIKDAAQDTIWFANIQVDPSNDYTYDAIYRLIEATGRENTDALTPPPHPEGAGPVGPLPSPNAVSRYTETYAYDSVGNFTEMRHRASRPSGRPSGDWTRAYVTHTDSNRLYQTWYSNDPATVVTYRHDPHGSMLNLDRTAPGLDIRWDWRDMIRALDLQGGGDAFYSYGIDKQRARKRLVRNGGSTEDRIYLGGYELYRRRDPQGQIVEEIESHHLVEGEQRVLLVDDVVQAPSGTPATLFRYQYGNHLGSVSNELDEAGQVISYEEFHPYGTSAYRLMNSAKEAPPKRYRYTGMERDEESGLGYHGARYLSSALGRWISVDPAGISDGLALFRYAKCNPISNRDSSGLQTQGTVGVTRGIADSQRREAAEKTRILGDMAHHPEQYPSVSEETKAAMRAEVAALNKTAGSLETHADIETDFHKNVGLPATVSVAAATTFVAAGGVAAGAAVLEAGWGVGSLYVRGLMVGISETVAALKTTGSLTAALYTAALSKELLGTAIVVTEVVLTSDQPFNPTATLSGAVTAPVAAEARMTKDELVATSKDLFRRVVTDLLESKGVKVTEAAIATQRKVLTVGVLQGTRNGEQVVLVAVNNANFFKSLEKVAAQEGFETVMGDALLNIGKRGYPLAKMGFEHAEAPLVKAAQNMSLAAPEMASSNLGCWECQWRAIEGGVTHMNPKPLAP